MVEFFEHTADVGLRVRAPDLATVLAEGGRALFARMVAWPEAIAVREERELTVEGDDPEYLFFDWLNELLYLFDTTGWLGRDFSVDVGDSGASGRIGGEPLDLARHGEGNEIKAITYHGLRVERRDDLWLAEVIIDI